MIICDLYAMQPDPLAFQTDRTDRVKSQMLCLRPIEVQMCILVIDPPEKAEVWEGAWRWAFGTKGHEKLLMVSVIGT